MKAISCQNAPGAHWQDNLGQAISAGSSQEPTREAPCKALGFFLSSGGLLVERLPQSNTDSSKKRTSSECPPDVSVISQEQHAAPHTVSQTCPSFFSGAPVAWG